MSIRSAYGVTRTGTVSRTSSGDFAIAFSTAQRIDRYRSRIDNAPPVIVDKVHILGDRHLTLLFQAVIEATEEAVLNAMFASEAMTGRDGHHIPALPTDRVIAALKAAGRIE